MQTAAKMEDVETRMSVPPLKKKVRFVEGQKSKKTERTSSLNREKKDRKKPKPEQQSVKMTTHEDKEVEIRAKYENLKQLVQEEIKHQTHLHKIEYKTMRGRQGEAARLQFDRIKQGDMALLHLKIAKLEMNMGLEIQAALDQRLEEATMQLAVLATKSESVVSEQQKNRRENADRIILGFVTGIQCLFFFLDSLAMVEDKTFDLETCFRRDLRHMEFNPSLIQNESDASANHGDARKQLKNIAKRLASSKSLTCEITTREFFNQTKMPSAFHTVWQDFNLFWVKSCLCRRMKREYAEEYTDVFDWLLRRIEYNRATFYVPFFLFLSNCGPHTFCGDDFSGWLLVTEDPDIMKVYFVSFFAFAFFVV